MVAWVLGCNRYDLFRVETGDDQRRDNVADILFVIDSSSSMVEESIGLAENFARFVDRLEDREDGYGTDGLPDAVDKYIAYVREPGYFVDYQLAITTVDAEVGGGRLLGDPPILRKGDPDLADAFVRTLVCEATCFGGRDVIPSDPGVSCGEAWNGEVTRESLDCLCGVDAWLGHCGGNREEGLEAVLGTMCRAAEEPPPECFDPDPDAYLLPEDAHTAAGFLRPGATLVPVVVTDEGDSSHRTQDVDPNPASYGRLYGRFGQFMSWAVIGPALDENQEPRCEASAPSWGVLRYDYLVQQTGGLKVDVYAEDCGPADFADALERLGDLVSGGVSAFPLAEEPTEGSIGVRVGHRTVHEAEDIGSDVFGVPIYDSGWTYREADRTVLLHGEAIPEPGQDVLIYYLPVHRR